MKYVLVSTICEQAFVRIFNTEQEAEEYAVMWLRENRLLQKSNLVDFQDRLDASEWFHIMEAECEDQVLEDLKDAAGIIIKAAKITPGMAAVIGGLMIEIREREQAKEDQK